MMIDPTIDEFEEERNFEEFEEDQGLANQGKLSKLDAYLNPIHLPCRLHKGLLKCMILYCYNSCNNYIVGSCSTSQLISSFEIIPFEHLFITLLVVAC
jgi:hypothetical protein